MKGPLGPVAGSVRVPTFHQDESKKEIAVGTMVQSHPLISIRSNATVQEAARLMADCSISAVGVLDKERCFAGIVTERDLSWFVAQAKDSADATVGEIVNDFPVVTEGPVDAEAALERMRKARIRHLIVQEDGEFRIVSMRDYLTEAPGRGQSESLIARDLMTAPAIACREEAFFEEVVETLAERDISGMPVVDSRGTVVGVISERDLAHALGGPMVRLALRRHNDHRLHDVANLPRGARRAREIMTSPAMTVNGDAPIEEIARLMRVHQINRVPVIEDGSLIGVVTRGDVLAALAHLEHEPIDLDRPPVLIGSAGLHPGVVSHR
jgi:CBS domain-containing protein